MSKKVNKEVKDVKEDKIKFLTAYSKINLFKIPVGSRTRKEYGAVLDKSTQKVVVRVVKEYDIVDSIQSYRKDTDIYYLIQKYNNGELVPNGANNLFYGDFSSMPSDFVDMTNQLQRAEGAFNSLSQDFKDKYHLKTLKDYLDALTSGVFFTTESKPIKEDKPIKDDNKGDIEDEK